MIILLHSQQRPYIQLHNQVKDLGKRKEKQYCQNLSS